MQPYYLSKSTNYRYRNSIMAPMGGLLSLVPRLHSPALLGPANKEPANKELAYM